MGKSCKRGFNLTFALFFVFFPGHCYVFEVQLWQLNEFLERDRNDFPLGCFILLLLY